LTGAAQRRPRPTRFAGATLATLALGLAGCGGTTIDKVHGNRLTIYESLPLHGGIRLDSEAALNSARMALAERRGRIGRYRIRLRVLDDSTAKAGTWDPGQTEANARLAAADRTAIGYMGDLTSGASAISIPVLNRAGIAQVSPASTAVGLTFDGPGADPGEPEKYYPTRRRTFARVLPNDDVQAAAQVKLQQELGCTSTYVVNDGEVDGLDMATTFVETAKRAGLNVVGLQSFQPNQADYTGFAAGVAATHPDCLLISALSRPDVVLVTRQLAAALPHARIFGTAGLADDSFTDPALGGIPVSLDPRLLITVAMLDPSSYPPSGRAFLARYAQLYGTPSPYAIFGYEAMSLLLDAISRATDSGRETARRSRVVAALFSTRDRASALGTYSIDQDGDTSLNEYGVWRVVGGGLVFQDAIAG
jgi:branched-chain amino acid transport system substrate-binding protein